MFQGEVLFHPFQQLAKPPRHLLQQVVFGAEGLRGAVPAVGAGVIGLGRAGALGLAGLGGRALMGLRVQLDKAAAAQIV